MYSMGVDYGGEWCEKRKGKGKKKKLFNVFREKGKKGKRENRDRTGGGQGGGEGGGVKDTDIQHEIILLGC